MLWVRQAMEKLDSPEREILTLREYEQLSYSDIADLLRIPVEYGPLQAFSIASRIEELPGVAGKIQCRPENKRLAAASTKARHAMSSNRHPIEQEELMAYLDGELSADEATEALSHLEQCSECQTLAADFRNVSQELLAWEVESPDAGISPELNAALGERLQRRPAAKITSSRSENRVRTNRWVGRGLRLSSAWSWD